MTRGTVLSKLLAGGLLVAAVVVLMLAVVMPLRALDRQLAEEIAHYQRTIAANEAAIQRQPELARAAGTLRDPRAMAELLVSANSDSAAAAALHERTKELIAATRASLISIQALPPTDEAGHRRIGLRVQFAADLPGFQRVLHALEAGRPAVIVSNLYLRARTSRAAGIANPLDIQMDLIAYRKEVQG